MATAGLQRPWFRYGRGLLRRWDVFLGRDRSVAEEELLHVADNDFLVFAAGRVEAVLVKYHLAEFRPLVPGFLRHAVIDLLAEFGVKGRLVEAGQLLFQLYAKNFVRHIGSLMSWLTRDYLTAKGAHLGSGADLSGVRCNF